MIWTAAAAAAMFVAVWGWGPPGLGRLRSPPWQGSSRLRDTVLRYRLAWVQRGREASLLRDVPQVCDLLAVCLDSGRPARGALRAVVGLFDDPTRAVLSAVLHQIDLGVDEAQAWFSLGDAPGYRAVARDVSRSVGSGVALAELLRQHARDARRASAARAQVAARMTGVRSIVPLVLCFLPAFFLVGVVPIFGGLVAGVGP